MVYLIVMELILLVVAILIAYSAKFYTEKAFTLALFEKRYKLYDDFRNLLVGLLSNINEGPLPEHLIGVKILLLQTKYIFGEDIIFLLSQIKANIVGAMLYRTLINDIRNGFKHEDAENQNLIHKFNEQNSQLYVLVGRLVDDNNSTNLISCFEKYLADDDFKKPITKPFWKRICETVSGLTC